MPGPGEYRPDPSEGITRIEDLPKPKIRCQSRNYRRRPCPRCGHSAYRDRRVRRTLHDLGNPLTGRPRDMILIYSQHYCLLSVGGRGNFRDCSKDTGLSHHAAFALCRVLVVWARPWACCSRSRSSASRPSIARCVRTRYTVFCILR